MFMGGRDILDYIRLLTSLEDLAETDYIKYSQLSQSQNREGSDILYM